MRAVRAADPLVLGSQRIARRAGARARARTGSGLAELELLDVSDLGSVHRLATKLADRTIDVSVHDAGVLPAERVAWLAAARRARGFTGRFLFDREARHAHWLPTTRESRAEREAFRRLCEIATAGAPAEVVPVSGRA